MGAPAARDVVHVPFPFSDLTQSKIRPAICLANAGRGDLILCQVTSQPYGDPLAIQFDDHDFLNGGLRISSFARPGKLFTADASLIVSHAGKLSEAAFARIRDSVVNLLRIGRC